MRMATPGQARLTLVRASPCLRLMRGPSRHHELFAASTRFSVVSSVGPAGRHQHRRSGRRRQAVELLVERAAALDVGKDEVVTRIRVPDAAGVGRDRQRRRQAIRTYPTFTSSLEALADWLQAEGVAQVVMEATGQYWKPCWYVLEERGFQLLLVNARHVKILPGRKTADTRRCGLAVRAAGVRAAARQLRAATGHPPAAGSDPLPQAAHPGPQRRVSADPKDPGGRRHQVSALKTWWPPPPAAARRHSVRCRIGAGRLCDQPGAADRGPGAAGGGRGDPGTLDVVADPQHVRRPPPAHRRQTRRRE
jgi:Transposase